MTALAALPAFDELGPLHPAVQPTGAALAPPAQPASSAWAPDLLPYQVAIQPQQGVCPSPSLDKVGLSGAEHGADTALHPVLSNAAHGHEAHAPLDALERHDARSAPHAHDATHADEATPRGGCADEPQGAPLAIYPPPHEIASLSPSLDVSDRSHADGEPGWLVVGGSEADAAVVTEEALMRNLADPWWRLTHLYRIATEEGEELRFVPNDEQADLYRSVWYANLVLKARQLGFTTLLTIMALDQCLFVGNFTAAIVFHNLLDAEKAFRNKIKFAYDRLPEELRSRLKVKKETSTEMVFANGSSIGVGVSARSGTIQWLHVSEFGKICAKYPDKAREVVTGSFNAVPPNGLIFIESTAEGQEGYFYDYCMEALRRQQEGRKAAKGQFKLHFYPWWKKASYVNHDTRISVDPESQTYFDGLRKSHGIELTIEQMRWYVAKAGTQGEDMKREYPSYPEEAFEQAVIGVIYAKQMSWLRANNRIGRVPHDPGLLVNTFWDLGQNDVTAIWFHQRVGMENRFIRYYEAAGEGFSHFVQEMNRQPYTFGSHYLPHDGKSKRQAEKSLESAETILKRLGLKNIRIVPRIGDITTGLDLTRQKLPTCWIDREGCATGIKALDSYRYEWDEKRGAFTNVPLHNWASNGADAIRQWAQGFLVSAANSDGFRRHRGSWRA